MALIIGGGPLYALKRRVVSQHGTLNSKATFIIERGQNVH